MRLKKKSGVLFTSIGLVVSIGLGVGAGIVINRFFLGPAVAADYSIYEDADFAPDYEASLNQYNKNKGKVSDYSQIFKPEEIVNIGYAKFASCEYSCAFSYGTVDAGITTQAVRAMDIRRGNAYFQESTSYGMVKVGTRTYLENDQIKLYRASDLSTNAEVATWNQDSEVLYTKEKYSEDFGKTPDKPIIILISKYTIKSANTTKTNSGYTVELEFDKVKSVLRYVKQMKSISNLYEEPTFYSISATFDLDADLNLKKMATHEHYYARISANVGSPSKGTLEVYYHANMSTEIPSLDENIDYSGGRY